MRPATLPFNASPGRAVVSSSLRISLPLSSSSAPLQDPPLLRRSIGIHGDDVIDTAGRGPTTDDDVSCGFFTRGRVHRRRTDGRTNQRDVTLISADRPGSRSQPPPQPPPPAAKPITDYSIFAERASSSSSSAIVRPVLANKRRSVQLFVRTTHGQNSGVTTEPGPLTLQGPKGQYALCIATPKWTIEQK